ncbi:MULTISPECIES: radical SAM/SPASM domain-containing protein [Streptomyces]|uniref:radical SAM/SPASM domain-containing protein n=1 Tax=Streptomyces TaxID=1883 RepID=UPI00163B97FD|nr:MULTISPECIES: radical SAM protein [Streptomyces]MBC2876131.1 radical SAM protein [Streptomyces sp. TYQ1024]UBI38488.1 radical SAM protein [Streptomyces mobaraensis]UKW31072.1 radical SAM protein [Streptomyces sp. TYQ1024]
MTTSVQAHPLTDILSVEFEITARCDLECSHCCTLSGPRQTHGTMTLADWKSAVDQVAALGIPMVQFIGGEPTLYPHLPALVEHALDRRLGVEVYSNLTHIRPSLWSLFERNGVRLATSYYSDDPVQHEQITGGRGSHARTRANIVETLRRGIPLRVGIVDVLDGQRVAEAETELRSLGIQHIRVDRVRAVGRAAGPTADAPSVDELCGRCYHQRAAISPDGDVYGCILSRNFPAGNLRQDRLATVFTGPRWAEIAERVTDARNACTPDDSNDCDPANTTACAPAFPK